MPLTLRLICGYLLRSLLSFLTYIYETLLDLEIYKICPLDRVGVIVWLRGAGASRLTLMFGRGLAGENPPRHTVGTTVIWLALTLRPNVFNTFC